MCTSDILLNRVCVVFGRDHLENLGLPSIIINVFHDFSVQLGRWKKNRQVDIPFHIPHLKLAGIVQPKGVIILLGKSAVILKTSIA